MKTYKDLVEQLVEAVPKYRGAGPDVITGKTMSRNQQKFSPQPVRLEPPSSAKPSDFLATQRRAQQRAASAARQAPEFARNLRPGLKRDPGFAEPANYLTGLATGAGAVTSGARLGLGTLGKGLDTLRTLGGNVLAKRLVPAGAGRQTIAANIPTIGVGAVDAAKAATSTSPATEVIAGVTDAALKQAGLLDPSQERIDPKTGQRLSQIEPTSNIGQGANVASTLASMAAEDPSQIASIATSQPARQGIGNVIGTGLARGALSNLGTAIRVFGKDGETPGAKAAGELVGGTLGSAPSTARQVFDLETLGQGVAGSAVRKGIEGAVEVTPEQQQGLETLFGQPFFASRAAERQSASTTEPGKFNFTDAAVNMYKRLFPN